MWTSTRLFPTPSVTLVLELERFSSTTAPAAPLTLYRSRSRNASSSAARSNGSGKSTILRIVTGCPGPSAATARVGGFDIVRHYAESITKKAFAAWLPRT
jgi:ABC-type transport system involved in cytochrome bd biosynthesis fused ATPase/permease subunit